MEDELASYLRALAGEADDSSYLEIRYRVASQALAAEFHPAHDRSSLMASIRERSGSTDVYVGCAPRRRRSGTKNDVAEVWVVWAECDGAAAAAAAAEYSPEPSMMVASGSGPNVHAYWRLRRPLAPREAELANLRLACAIGADRACYDAARILRPPQTWNHKRSPPSPVRAVRMSTHVSFEAADVLAHAPQVDQEPVHRRWREPSRRRLKGDPLLRLPPVVYVSELLDVRARPGRKVHCPFHADERPSLHVYPTASRGWCCFSCRRGGSVYDLAAALWGTGTRGRDFVALRRLLLDRFARELEYVSRGLER